MAPGTKRGMYSGFKPNPLPAEVRKAEDAILTQEQAFKLNHVDPSIFVEVLPTALATRITAVSTRRGRGGGRGGALGAYVHASPADRNLAEKGIKFLLKKLAFHPRWHQWLSFGVNHGDILALRVALRTAGDTLTMTALTPRLSELLQVVVAPAGPSRLVQKIMDANAHLTDDVLANCHLLGLGFAAPDIAHLPITFLTAYDFSDATLDSEDVRLELQLTGGIPLLTLDQTKLLVGNAGRVTTLLRNLIDGGSVKALRTFLRRHHDVYVAAMNSPAFTRGFRQFLRTTDVQSAALPSGDAAQIAGFIATLTAMAAPLTTDIEITTAGGEPAIRNLMDNPDFAELWGNPAMQLLLSARFFRLMENITTDGNQRAATGVTLAMTTPAISTDAVTFVVKVTDDAILKVVAPLPGAALAAIDVVTTDLTEAMTNVIDGDAFATTVAADAATAGMAPLVADPAAAGAAAAAYSLRHRVSTTQVIMSAAVAAALFEVTDPGADENSVKVAADDAAAAAKAVVDADAGIPRPGDMISNFLDTWERFPQVITAMADSASFAAALMNDQFVSVFRNVNSRVLLDRQETRDALYNEHILQALRNIRVHYLMAYPEFLEVCRDFPSQFETLFKRYTFAGVDEPAMARLCLDNANPHILLNPRLSALVKNTGMITDLHSDEMRRLILSGEFFSLCHAVVTAGEEALLRKLDYRGVSDVTFAIGEFSTIFPELPIGADPAEVVTGPEVPTPSPAFVAALADITKARGAVDVAEITEVARLKAEVITDVGALTTTKATLVTLVTPTLDKYTTLKASPISVATGAEIDGYNATLRGIWDALLLTIDDVIANAIATVTTLEGDFITHLTTSDLPAATLVHDQVATFRLTVADCLADANDALAAGSPLVVSVAAVVNYVPMINRLVDFRTPPDNAAIFAELTANAAFPEFAEFLGRGWSFPAYQIVFGSAVAVEHYKNLPGTVLTQAVYDQVIIPYLKAVHNVAGGAPGTKLAEKATIDELVKLPVSAKTLVLSNAELPLALRRMYTKLSDPLDPKVGPINVGLIGVLLSTFPDFVTDSTAIDSVLVPGHLFETDAAVAAVFAGTIPPLTLRETAFNKKTRVDVNVLVHEAEVADFLKAVGRAGLATAVKKNLGAYLTDTKTVTPFLTILTSRVLDFTDQEIWDFVAAVFRAQPDGQSSVWYLTDAKLKHLVDRPRLPVIGTFNALFDRASDNGKVVHAISNLTAAAIAIFCDIRFQTFYANFKNQQRWNTPQFLSLLKDAGVAAWLSDIALPEADLKVVLDAGSLNLLVASRAPQGASSFDSFSESSSDEEEGDVASGSSEVVFVAAKPKRKRKNEDDPLARPLWPYMMNASRELLATFSEVVENDEHLEGYRGKLTAHKDTISPLVVPAMWCHGAIQQYAALLDTMPPRSGWELSQVADYFRHIDTLVLSDTPPWALKFTFSGKEHDILPFMLGGVTQVGKTWSEFITMSKTATPPAHVDTFLGFREGIFQALGWFLNAYIEEGPVTDGQMVLCGETSIIPYLRMFYKRDKHCRRAVESVAALAGDALTEHLSNELPRESPPSREKQTAPNELMYSVLVRAAYLFDLYAAVRALPPSLEAKRLAGMPAARRVQFQEVQELMHTYMENHVPIALRQIRIERPLEPQGPLFLNAPDGPTILYLACAISHGSPKMTLHMSEYCPNGETAVRLLQDSFAVNGSASPLLVYPRTAIVNIDLNDSGTANTTTYGVINVDSTFDSEPTETALRFFPANVESLAAATVIMTKKKRIRTKAPAQAAAGPSTYLATTSAGEEESPEFDLQALAIPPTEQFVIDGTDGGDITEEVDEQQVAAAMNDFLQGMDNIEDSIVDETDYLNEEDFYVAAKHSFVGSDGDSYRVASPLVRLLMKAANKEQLTLSAPHAAVAGNRPAVISVSDNDTSPFAAPLDFVSEPEALLGDVSSMRLNLAVNNSPLGWLRHCTRHRQGLPLYVVAPMLAANLVSRLEGTEPSIIQEQPLPCSFSTQQQFPMWEPLHHTIRPFRVVLKSHYKTGLDRLQDKSPLMAYLQVKTTAEIPVGPPAISIPVMPSWLERRAIVSLCTTLAATPGEHYQDLRLPVWAIDEAQQNVVYEGKDALRAQAYGYIRNKRPYPSGRHNSMSQVISGFQYGTLSGAEIDTIVAALGGRERDVIEALAATLIERFKKAPSSAGFPVSEFAPDPLTSSLASLSISEPGGPLTLDELSTNTVSFRTHNMFGVVEILPGALNDELLRNEESEAWARHLGYYTLPLDMWPSADGF